jgi:hypothetical protein
VLFFVSTHYYHPSFKSGSLILRTNNREPDLKDGW